MMNTRLLALFSILVAVVAAPSVAQTVTSFEGINASQLANPQYDVDPNGAIGTKQYMEWTNAYFQAYDKVTFAPVWSTPQGASSPWKQNGITTCNQIVLDGIVLFDRLASRWVLAAHTSTLNNYYYCIAVSNTDDLTSSSLAWYTYAFPLNSVLGTNSEGNVYFPDWPKIGTWSNGYYASFDLNDINLGYREVGVLVCAFDRTNMLVNGTAHTPICFKQPGPVTTTTYLGHSLIPADIEGTTPPPTGRDEFLTSIENPVLDGSTKTSGTFNLWDFHVNWTTPSSSTLTQTSISESPYQPGCYEANVPTNTVCVPEPSSASTGNKIDSVGDRFMPGMSYRNFGSYESFVVSHTVQVATTRQTGVRWYELRANGSGTPSLYQDGNVSPDQSLSRFLPSIAEDANGNAAVGYSVSSSSTHPGISASYFSLTNSTAPTEISLLAGTADEENTWHWGSYSGMTVDPEDGCTFWYANEYYPTNQTGSEIVWGTRISNFQVPGCGSAGLSPNTFNFGQQAVNVASSPQAITLTNGQDVALNISSFSFTGSNPGDFSQTNNCGSSVAAGGSCNISVTFTPGASGARSATLNVNDDASNSPQTATLTGTGFVPASVTPTSFNFGNVLVDAKSSMQATLSNSQSVALTGISISVSGAASFSQVNTCGSSIPADSTCPITVTFAPTAGGAQTATLNIVDSAGNSPQSIALKGTGLQPVALNPGGLSFGSQTVGTTSAVKTITVVNHEKSAVSFTSIQINGTDRADYTLQTNTCGSSLASGTTCTLSVTFTPQATGTRTANLVLTDNAATSPQTAKLSGSGD